MIHISVVTFNSEVHIDALVESILRQSISFRDFKITFFDNNSSDNTILKIREYESRFNASGIQFSLIESKENVGFGVGHNAALEGSVSEFLLILNPDCVLTPDTLQLLVLDAQQKNERFVAFEPRQLPYEHPKIYDTLSAETSWCSAACLLLKRAAWNTIEGFDPKIFLYGEDVDLCWRLRDQGFALAYVPQASVYHHTYEYPEELKTTQFFGSTKANLLLRIRFGSYKDILIGIIRQCRLILGTTIVSGQRLAGLRHIFFALSHFAYFRSKAQREGFRPRFYGWDYSQRRQGAFFDSSQGFELKTQPLVSIVIRSIGRTEFVKAAIQTIHSQTYKNIEIVLVEDGSSQLKADFENVVTYYSFSERVGRCVAGNKGVEIAKGSYINFLDEDDLLYADHIEQLVAKAEQNKSDVVYSFGFELPSTTGSNGSVEYQSSPFARHVSDFSFFKLLKENYIPINAVLFKKKLFEQADGFDPHIDLNEDWDLWVRMAILKRPFHCIKKTTCLYRVPLTPQVSEQRKADLIKFYDIARSKHDSLTVQCSVGELFQELYGSSGQAVGLQGLLLSRFPHYSFVIRLLFSVVNRARTIKSKLLWKLRSLVYKKPYST